MTHSYRGVESSRTLWRIACTVLICALVGAWFPGVARGETDDAVPGVPMPPSPVLGSVTDADPIDIYSVTMIEGDSLRITLSVTDGAAKVEVLAPGSPTSGPSITQTLATPGSPGSIQFTAGADGTYYVKLESETSPCDYSLAWAVVAPPTPVIVLTPTWVDLVVAKDGPDSRTVEVSVTNTNGGFSGFMWFATGDQPWLAVESSSMPEMPLSVSASGAGLAVGTYYGNVTVSAKRAASVLLPVRLRVLPGVSISSSATKKVVGYNKRVTLTAKLRNKSGKTLKGRALALYREVEDDEWIKVRTIRSKTGSYKTTVPIKYRTRFRWEFEGDSKYGPGASAIRTTRCRAYLTPPKVPKTQGFYTTYSGKGTLKPPLREGSGTVTISYYAWKRAGYWSLISRETVETSDGYYVSRCAWQGFGRWKCRVRATFRGPDHALTYSAWRYFRVQ